MSERLLSYSEEMLDKAWFNTSHHIDAYHGYPAIQQDILATEAGRLTTLDQNQRARSQEIHTGHIALVKTAKIS